MKIKMLTIALVLAATSAFAEDRNWPGGTGTSGEPLDINAGDNWEGTAVTSDDNLFFAADDYTYLTNTHDSATLTCNVIYFNSGDFSFSGDLKTRAVRNGAKDNAADNKNVSVLKKSGNWTLTSDFYSRYGTYPAEYSSVVFTNESGNVSASLASYVCAHPNSYMKVVNLDGNMTFANNLTLANTSTSTGVVEVAGGSLSVGSDLYVGSSGTGMLTVSGGTVEMTNAEKNLALAQNTGSSGTINLNGGTLETTPITKGKGTASIVFGGGKLKAKKSDTFIPSGVTVTVGDGDGTIDNGGNNITIGTALGGTADTGRLRLTGTGTTTLSSCDIKNGNIVVADGCTVSVSTVTYIGNAENASGSVEVDNGAALNISGNLYIGSNVTQSEGTLTVNGGTVEVDSSRQIYPGYGSGSSGTINLNGGILKTRRIAHKDGSAAINFNGGTLQANYGYQDLTAANTEFIKNGITVTVGEGGGTIDNGGYNIKTGVSNITGQGGLVFKGDGTTTLGKSDSIGSSYSGITSIERGTTLVAYKMDAQKILTKGVALIGTPELNTPYTLMKSANDANWDELTNFDKEHVMCPAAAEYTIERVKGSADDTYTNTIVVTVTAHNPAFWTGAKDNNLSDSDNWLDGVVPQPGTNATIWCASAATLTVGDTFAPSAITFAANSAPVTIDGRDLTGIVAVTNHSSASHTIKAKVYFAGDIQVKQNADYFENRALSQVTFAGGAYAAEGCSIETGSTVNWSRCMFGKYYLANVENKQWTVTAYSNCRPMLAVGSELHVPYAGNLQELVALDGANVYVGNLAINAGGRLSKWIKGSMTVTNLVVSGSGDVYISSAQGTATQGVFKFNSVTNGIAGGANDNSFYLADSASASRHVFYIGEGGLGYTSSATVFYIGRDADNNYETIRPWYSDFTIGHRGGTDIGLGLRRDVEFCTDDESDTGRTITVDAITCAQNTPTITISGKGKLKINKAAKNTVQPPITLKDTVTLEYAAGATLGTGPLTLGAGTTLVVASSHLPISVDSLSLPESGTATIQIVGDALAAGDYAIIASAAGLPAGFEEKLNVVVPGGAGNVRLYPADNNGKIGLFVGEGDLPDPYTWTGAANDGKMSTPGNWRGNAVPPAGATVFIPPTAGALNNDIENFAPASITFGYGTGEVTIGGNDITDVAAVTNLSTTASHTINSKVYFAGNIQVSQDAMGGDGDLAKAHVTFAGGAYAAKGFALESANSDPVYSRCIFGEYFLANAAESPWTVKGSTGGNGHRRNCLAPNSILHAPYAGDIGTLYIGSNAKVLIGSHTAINPRLAYRNYGEMIVTNLILTGSSDIHATYQQETSSQPVPVFKFASVTNSLSGTNRFRMHDEKNDAKHVFYIGKGGLNFSDSTGQYIIGRDTTENYETICPWNDDFTIAGKGDNIGIYLLGNIEFCTNDENGFARTITLDAKSVVRPKTALTISGKGILKVNNTYVQDSSGELKAITLKDSATLEYGTATASLGTGTITLGAGTTFAFQSTGRELSLPSTIALPATGTATLRIDGARLRSGDHTVMSGVADDADKHLTLDGESAALDGRKGSLRVVKQADDSYNLILDITPVGTMFMVY